MLVSARVTFLAAFAILTFTGQSFVPAPAAATSDAVRNSLARKDCKRGTFKDYYLQGQGGDPPLDYKGRDAIMQVRPALWPEQLGFD